MIDRIRWILRKRDVGAWTGLIWLRIGTGGIVYQIAILLEISSTSIDTSDQRLLQLFKGPGAVAVCFTGIKTALVNCLSIFNWS